MTLSAFADKSTPPTDAALTATLAKSAPLWRELLTHFADLDPLWNFSGKSTGWGLRLKSGDRIIVYMTPCNGHFLTSFVLGEKAMQEARKLDREELTNARKYAEGYGVRFAIRTREDVSTVIAVAALKLR